MSSVQGSGIGIGIFLPMPLTHSGAVNYTCRSIAAGLGHATTIITPRTDKDLAQNVQSALPYLLRRVPFSWVKYRSKTAIEREFLDFMRSLKTDHPAAYCFPSPSLGLIEKLKREGVTVFREMINCHQGAAKIILDDAYERMGKLPTHGITNDSVQTERNEIHSSDYLFCSNPMAEKSLLEIGVPSSKILNVSYGWDPARFPDAGSQQITNSDHLEVLSVGTVCVRKGSHLLIDYWIKSGVCGRLTFVGEIEPILREQLENVRQRGAISDIQVIDYNPHIGRHYRKADIFVMPTLEEGGPLVTYEACGFGLPIMTTQMGAARIVRDGHEGFILDAYDANAWISKFREFAKHKTLRAAMGTAARERAKQFTWDIVAAQRGRMMKDVLQG